MDMNEADILAGRANDVLDSSRLAASG